jgi:hypothetical protein
MSQKDPLYRFIVVYFESNKNHYELNPIQL